MNSFDPTLIAPCGLDCQVCYAYLREKDHCPGCREDDTQKMKSCLVCKIKNCEKLTEGDLKYCFECDSYPCESLKKLDKRYRTKYGVNPFENLNTIQENGIDAFVEIEMTRWTCPDCGTILCMHRPQCLACGYDWKPPD